jgi:hypothetical protein
MHGSLRGYDLQHGDRLCALVCGACRQQVVYPGGRRGTAVIEALASMDLQYPEVSEAQFKELAAAKEALIAGDEL